MTFFGLFYGFAFCLLPVRTVYLTASLVLYDHCLFLTKIKNKNGIWTFIKPPSVLHTSHHMYTGKTMKASMVSEGGTEPGSSKHEKDRPREAVELIPKQSAPSVAWMWFSCKSLTQIRKLLSKF